MPLPKPPGGLSLGVGCGVWEQRPDLEPRLDQSMQLPWAAGGDGGQCRLGGEMEWREGYRARGLCEPI